MCRLKLCLFVFLFTSLCPDLCSYLYLKKKIHPLETRLPILSSLNTSVVRDENKDERVRN